MRRRTKGFSHDVVAFEDRAMAITRSPDSPMQVMLRLPDRPDG
jgi:hypothetical protein